ncbi:MAG: efflux RND transporter periplasmic adaptor subunit [Polyangiaceae bacterium]
MVSADMNNPPADARTHTVPEAASLQKALAREEGGRKWVVRLVWVLCIAALAVVGVAVRAKNQAPPPARYMVAEVAVGDVAEKVQATGAVQPLLQVNVGSQVNGRVTRVPVDFNTPVKKGDVLAEIDGTFYGAQVSQSAASLAAQQAQIESSKANAAAAKANYERLVKLASQNLAGKAEVDSAKGQYEVAEAQILATRAQANALSAQLSQAQTNAGFTKIYSPVDGIVISRAIDPGATVVASFQTPTLFVIARDLKRMRVMADVDEADVGKLKEGMDVEATVDAFPGETFRGRVEQVRYSPNNVQGVVTYAAVVEVSNPDEKLRPGMTATVTVKTNEAKATAIVPNSALRFKPAPPQGPDGKPLPQPVEAPLPKGKARVYVLTNAKLGEEKIEPRIVGVGVTDGLHTVVTDLPSGTKVVTDETDEDARKGGKKGKMF